MSLLKQIPTATAAPRVPTGVSPTPCSEPESQSLYNLNDPAGETMGFDYDNPYNHPYDGTVLKNILMVNGTVVLPGTNITPLNP